MKKFAYSVTEDYKKKGQGFQNIELNSGLAFEYANRRIMFRIIHG